MSAFGQLRQIAGRPLCPSMTEDGIRHVARNVDDIVCSCDPECPDEAWWDRYGTAADILAVYAALPALLDVAEAAERIYRADNRLDAEIVAALHRLRKAVTADE